MGWFQRITGKIRREKLIISQFREQGALSIELAKELNEIGEINRSAFNRLYRKGVIEEGGGNTYFLSDNGLMKYRMDRVKWAMILLFILLMVILITY
ncbi:MAG: hypothetical protein ABFR36_02285 [Acidobacteriota bacterium]